MENDKKARIGFVGCGSHATGSLYPTIHTIPEFDLVAVCDLKEELAQRNARNFGALRWYTDVDKMLSEEELDGAVIVGAPQMHCVMGKKCLDGGLPIFVEKPSAISYKDAIDLAEYAKDKGLFGAVAFMKRQSTCYRMAKTITEKEEFGNISEIELRFANGRYPKLWGIEEPARTFLVGQAVHMFDLIRFFCGDVTEIYAALNEVEKFDKDAVFGYAVTVTFKTGAVGVMNINATQGPGWQMSEYFVASGYECWVEVKDMASLHYYPHDQFMPEFGIAQTFNATSQIMGYKEELQNFARSVLGREKVSADLFDGAKALEIAEAIWASSQTGKPISIE